MNIRMKRGMALVLMASLLLAGSAQAADPLLISRGTDRAIPIAVVPFGKLDQRRNQQWLTLHQAQHVCSLNIMLIGILILPWPVCANRLSARPCNRSPAA